MIRWLYATCFWGFLFCAAIGFLLLNVPTQKKNWFASFAQNINERDIERARLVQIWVGTAGESRPIGGSEQQCAQWAAAISELLHECQATGASLEVLLIVDEAVLAQNQDLQKHWEKQYPLSVRWIVVSSLIEQMPEKMSCVLSTQCSWGIPAICSDVVRLAALSLDDTDLAIYADIDTLTQAWARGKGDSAAFLGLTELRPGIRHHYFTSQSQVSWNNDLIVRYHAMGSMHKILALAEKNFLQHASVYNDLSEQHQRLNALNQGNYLTDLHQRTQAFQQNPTRNINRYSQILSASGVGPGLWRRASMCRWAEPYNEGELHFVDNAFSWRSCSQVLDGAVNWELLTQRFNHLYAQDCLEIVLLIEDALFQYKQQGVVSLLLCEEIRERCQRQPEIQKGLKLFYSQPDKTLAFILSNR